jgi:hypothetical protein
MGVMEWILTEIAAIILRVVMVSVTARAKAQIPNAADQVISWAVDILPEDQRARYHEEWRGLLAETPGDLAKAREAIGILVASWRMGGSRRDHGPEEFFTRRKSKEIALVTGAICIFYQPNKLLVTPKAVLSVANITRTRLTFSDLMRLYWVSLRDWLRPGNNRHGVLLGRIASRIVGGVDGTQIAELLAQPADPDPAWAEFDRRDMGIVRCYLAMRMAAPMEFTGYNSEKRALLRQMAKYSA